MKIRNILIALTMVVACCGCGVVRAENHEMNDNEFVLPQVESVIDSEECCICGENERSLMPYYRKSGMIGLVCLNTMEISSLDTRHYSDDGTQIISGAGLSITTSSHGEDECSFHVSGMPDGGILEGKVYYGEKCEPDFDVIKSFLCQACLDTVLKMYQDEMKWGSDNSRFPEVCLVDFKTNELYTLGKTHVGYWIRDYWVHIDHEDEYSDVMVIYAPQNRLDLVSQE